MLPDSPTQTSGHLQAVDPAHAAPWPPSGLHIGVDVPKSQ
jgi:hypothetical protein